MMQPAGIDEFGREHLVVEAAPGRLGISLAENEKGYVVVRKLDDLEQLDLSLMDEVDKKRLHLLRQTVQVGDRLVQIEDEDVAHCLMREVVTRLSKLSAKKRLLTFARYYPTNYQSTHYDVEKLVHVRAPGGPLGLIMNDQVAHGAFVESFQRLPDGSMSKLARHPEVHRSCQIISINGTDVSSSSRDAVVAMLSSIRDQEKELVLYRMAPKNCGSLFDVEIPSYDALQAITFDESESHRSVLQSAGSNSFMNSHTFACTTGDVLVAVNNTDVSWMGRQDALGLLRKAVFPMRLTFYRCDPIVLPECHKVRIDPGMFGLDLDSNTPNHAKISGFSTPDDSKREAFKQCAHFIPGSYILAVNKLDVSQHTLHEVAALLRKAKASAKDIIIGNEVLLQQLSRSKKSHVVSIDVPGGPLGMNFDSAHPDVTRIIGFYPMADGKAGHIEADGKVRIGSTLIRINALDVSCLELAKVTAILKKLANQPKKLTFFWQDGHHDVNTKVVHIRAPAGPLGIDLKRSISNRVIIDRINRDATRGSTFIADHGAIVEGSEFVAIDGFDVSSLDLLEVTKLLQMLSPQEKVLTFTTSSPAYDGMFSPQNSVQKARYSHVNVEQQALGIEFDPNNVNEAVAFKYANRGSGSELIPLGSRLVAIDGVDLRHLTLEQITKVLRDYAGIPKDLVFDTMPSLNGTTSTSAAPPAAPSAVPDRARFSLMGMSSNSLPFAATPPTSPVAASNMQVKPLDMTALAAAYPQSSPAQQGASSPVSTSTYMQKYTMAQAPASPEKTAAATSPSPSAQLGSLSIKTMDALKPGSPVTDASKLSNTKKQQKGPEPMPLEYLVNMVSWKGSRSLYRLEIDDKGRSLTISNANPASPKGKGSSVTAIAFSDITGVDVGKGGQGGSPRRLSLLGGTSANDKTFVSIATHSKKNVEFEMRFPEEREQFYSYLCENVPALQTLR